MGGLDIRVPIGLMFLVKGLLLAVYGLMTPPETYVKSLGVNINLIWGAVLIVFSVVMLFLGRKGFKLAPEE